MDRKKLAAIATKLFGGIGLIIFFITTNIFEFKYGLFYSILLLIFNFFIVPILILFVINLFIGIFKVLFCLINGLEIKTIDLSILLLQFEPFSIDLMFNLNFITGNNLTTFKLNNYKISELKEIYERYYVPFSKIIILAILIVMLSTVIFYHLKLFYIIFIIIAVSLQKMIYMSVDDDLLVFNPIISNKKRSQEINYFWFLLNYIKTEKTDDKWEIYNYLSRMNFLHENEFWAYKVDLLSEMIIDSIIDKREYVSLNEYQFYLTKNTRDFNDGVLLNSIDLLRYFSLYNYLNTYDEQVYDEIIFDIKYQITMMEDDQVIKLLAMKQYKRYIEELEERHVNILLDFKSHWFYKFHYFAYKRKQVDLLFNTNKKAFNK